jgi:hypothetical protein
LTNKRVKTDASCGAHNAGESARRLRARR